MSRPLLVLIAAAFALASVAFVACGDDNENGNGLEKPTATAEVPPTEEPDLDEIRVRLLEWRIDPDVESVPAGSLTFNPDNIGGTDHELVIVRTDLAPDALPVLEDGSADLEAEGIEIVAASDVIGPGFSESLTVDVTPGAYVLICNLVDDTDAGPRAHYEEDMVTGFEVTE